MRKKLLLMSAVLFPVSLIASDIITRISMDVDDFGRIIEKVNGDKLTVGGKHTNENIPGAVGDALRFDGYSTYAKGDISTDFSSRPLTISMWVAPETYPIIKHDEATSEKAGLAGTFNLNDKQGWQFAIGQHGEYSFDCFGGGGWQINLEAEDRIPCYEWSHLVAVLNPDEGKIILYRNGVKVAENTSNLVKNLELNSKTLTIGKSSTTTVSSPYMLDTFNGLIDDIEIFDGALSEAEISSYVPENKADLSIPKERFAKDLLRPKFHGMPGANWTNETHGMTYSNGKYHVFFQKNANGPYMSRLHWGHISSTNLYDWTEEKIAIAPGDEYDIKGTWSGCVFTDDVLTEGKPNIIYTGVDYVKAMMALATPLDENLIEWEKSAANPIINGRPSGLSDDFRDPYFFRNGDDAFLIVGTSKDNLGATTLHKYNPASGIWSNDGAIFFSATDKASQGTFWEMPNITKMENGKWLFTATPQGQNSGVHAIYWTGSINADGTFNPDSQVAKQIELISEAGYGLLSPTIFQKDGKTIAMGIVPDKLPTDENCRLGWAHLYSFPREWSLDNEGNLIQKPYESLRELRSTGSSFIETDVDLDGDIVMSPVKGRQIELLSRFTVSSSVFGFRFLKDGSNEATVSYDPNSNRLTLDLTGLDRISNDKNLYNGIYSCTIPEKPVQGSEMTLNLFLDGSILDIFVNDRYATSIRVFPNGNYDGEVEAFSEGGSVKVNQLCGWVLSSNGNAGIGSIGNDFFSDKGLVSVYSMDGAVLKKNVKKEDALTGLEKGIYIVGNKKVVVR